MHNHHHHKLSLFTAILININITLGAGIFINTAILTQRAGGYGFLSYAIIGGLMLPLILSIASLLRLHPSGGFYVFGAQEIHPFIGFVSTWSYFIGKLASCTLMIHASVLFIQHLIPAYQTVSPFIFDGAIITLFILGNMLHLKTGSAIQRIFMAFKMLPILFVIISGFIFFDHQSLMALPAAWDTFTTTMPLVLYAIIGFEAACSISNRIEHAEKNAPLVVLTSFSIVIVISLLYQLFFYLLIGPELATAQYSNVFHLLVDTLIPMTYTWRLKLLGLMQIGIAVSALGGAYGILFSNGWNLHTLAHHNHVFGASLLRALNKHAIPYACILTEGLICLMYLTITQGSQLPLQQLGAFGCTLTYTISALAFVAVLIRTSASLLWKLIGSIAVFNCVVLLGSCLYNFSLHGMSALVAFLLLLGFGAFMYANTSGELEPTKD